MKKLIVNNIIWIEIIIKEYIIIHNVLMKEWVMMRNDGFINPKEIIILSLLNFINYIEILIHFGNNN